MHAQPMHDTSKYCSPVLGTFLYQGGRPPVGACLKDAGFDVLVLVAKEYQPTDRYFPGVQIVRAPIDDSRLTLEEYVQAAQAAQIVSQALARDKKVLTTCWMGWNRSGLVNALALVNLGVSPDKSIRLVRNARGPHALGNQSFVRAIHAHA